MVIRRPKNAEKEDAPGADLMEQMVKKSLAVNPALRGGGKDTHEVLAELKSEAIARSKAGTHDDKSKKDLSDRRRSTVAFFFQQISEEFESKLADITARERMLAKEKQALQAETSDEVVDFLSMITADAPEARDVLREYESFLGKLGAKQGDLLREAARKK